MSVLDFYQTSHISSILWFQALGIIVIDDVHQTFLLQKESSAKLYESIHAYLVYKYLEILPPIFCCPARHKLRKQSIGSIFGQK